jgi:hypothetical protein
MGIGLVHSSGGRERAFPDEKLLATMQRFGQLRFDGVLRDAQLVGDFAMGKIFVFTENEDFATPVG